MISFDFTPADEEVLAIARAQGRVHRARAKSIDREIDYDDPDVGKSLPTNEGLVHVRDVARERLEELSGWSLIESLIVLEEWAGSKPSFFPNDQDDNIGNPSAKLIKLIGKPEQYERWKDRKFAWGMTEPGAGSDPAGMRTTARPDPATGEWVINGEKTFITNGQSADGVMVMCRILTPDGDLGIKPIIVERGTPGFTAGPQMRKLGIRNSDLAPLAFADVRVPADHLLEGDLYKALSMFNNTRGTLAGQALGAAREALDIVRDQFKRAGVEVDYAQALSERSAAVDRLIRLEALYEATYNILLHTKWLEDRNGPEKVSASIAKLKAGEAVRKIVSGCMAILGPLSSSEDYPLEQLFRDSRIIDIYEGPGAVHRLIVGRSLLGYSSKQLN